MYVLQLVSCISRFTAFVLVGNNKLASSLKDLQFRTTCLQLQYNENRPKIVTYNVTKLHGGVVISTLPTLPWMCYTTVHQALFSKTYFMPQRELVTIMICYFVYTSLQPNVFTLQIAQFAVQSKVRYLIKSVDCCNNGVIAC